MELVKAQAIIESEIPADLLQRIEKIGRVCYKSEGKITETSAEKFVRALIRRGHESVLEHFSITARVICDRGVTHEIVRHRIASYSQESTRYCNYSGELKVIDLWNGMEIEHNLSNEEQEAVYETWLEAMHDAERYYKLLTELGATPQIARSVLPNSTKTELVMTMNLREWRHFFRLRCDKTAHPQMREVADILLDEFTQRIDIVFEDLV